MDSNIETQQLIGPIEKEMRMAMASLRNSSYPETEFDWGVYDRISRRFDTSPRGGVIFNTTFKLVNHHSSCSKCFYAFEIDSYGRGCLHNCHYCYAKEQLSTHGYWNRPMPFPVNLAEVRKVFHTVFETDRKSKWREVMEKRIPLRLGSMSDSFMWLDLKYGITKELLRILRHYRYPYIVFTRSDLAAHDDYIELLDKKLCAVQFSIAGNNEKLTKLLEPGAPSFRRRLVALEKLVKAGFWTTVRVNPLFAKYPDGFYTDPESIKVRFGSRSNVPTLDLYDDEFIPSIADAGVPSLLAGFVRLTSHAITAMSAASGIDVRSFFKPEHLEMRGDKRYSDAEIAYYYRLFQKQCVANNIRFSTCYIGNGIKDFFQYQDLWSNKGDCCDAVGNVAAIKRTSQEISWENRIKHAPSKDTAIAAQKMEIEADANVARSAQVGFALSDQYTSGKV